MGRKCERVESKGEVLGSRKSSLPSLGSSSSSSSFPFPPHLSYIPLFALFAKVIMTRDICIASNYGCAVTAFRSCVFACIQSASLAR